MTVRYTETFLRELLDQIAFIAEDKPEAAFKFKDDLEELISQIPNFPLKHRKSIFSDDVNIRDLIFKGYTITYRINQRESFIEILSLNK